MKRYLRISITTMCGYRRTTSGRKDICAARIRGRPDNGPDWKYVPDNEKDQRILFDRLGGKVLIVIVRHEDHSGDIYGTVTHNRARGTHLLEPMKKIVKELLDSGKPIEEIGKQLGMRPEEVFRLSEFSREDFLRMMAKGTS